MRRLIKSIKSLILRLVLIKRPFHNKTSKSNSIKATSLTILSSDPSSQRPIWLTIWPISPLKFSKVKTKCNSFTTVFKPWTKTYLRPVICRFLINFREIIWFWTLLKKRVDCSSLQKKHHFWFVWKSFNHRSCNLWSNRSKRNRGLGHLNFLISLIWLTKIARSWCLRLITSYQSLSLSNLIWTWNGIQILWCKGRNKTINQRIRQNKSKKERALTTLNSCKIPSKIEW